MTDGNRQMNCYNKTKNTDNDQQSFERRNERISDIKNLRVAFVVDECHRAVTPETKRKLEQFFNNSLWYGFTGTPIQDLNAKKDSTTPTIFGDEIHRYTLGDGIRDKNVLGFDPYMVRIYDDADIREKVALSKAKAKDQADAFSDPKKGKSIS